MLASFACTAALYPAHAACLSVSCAIAREGVPWEGKNIVGEIILFLHLLFIAGSIVPGQACEARRVRKTYRN